MTRKRNPLYEGLSGAEKNAVQAKSWQDNNREYYRQYQAAYHRKYNKDPRKQLPLLQTRVAQLNLTMERINIQYQAKLKPCLEKIEQIQKEIEQLTAQIAQGDLEIQRRNETANGN